MISDKRIQHINEIRLARIEPSNIEFVHNMELKYGKFDLIVFDLPLIKFDDMDKFNHIWNEHSILSKKTMTNPLNPTIDDVEKFRSLDLLDTDVDEFYSKKMWNHKLINLENEFPMFYQQIFDLLPFDKVTYINLWQSLMSIPLHRDSAYEYYNVPGEIRIMLYDENENGTLVIQPELVKQNIKMINLPSTSNTFAWNNIRCVHGSVKKHGKNKIIARVFGIMNLMKLTKLIDAGYKRYPEYAYITEDDFQSYLKP